MLTNTEKKEFQKLWAKATITLSASDVLTVDGLTFQLHTEMAEVIPLYGPSGWATNAASEIGGVRSKLVDATIQEAISKGFKEAAARVPKYHVAHFWSPPSTTFGWAVADPVRFSMPTDAQVAALGLSQAQLEQVQDNLIALDNWAFSLALGNPGYNGSTDYRGEKGKSGFAPVNATTGVVDFSPANPPGYVPNKLDVAYPARLAAAKYLRVYKAGSTTQYDRKTVQEYPNDHMIYDQWWDTQTDANVNRYWRNWLASVGVPLKD